MQEIPHTLSLHNVYVKSALSGYTDREMIVSCMSGAAVHMASIALTYSKKLGAEDYGLSNYFVWLLLDVLNVISHHLEDTLFSNAIKHVSHGSRS